MKKILAWFGVGLVISLAAGAQPGRFAVKEELVGYWEMVPIPDAEKINQVNPWPIAYQWFGFYEDGILTTMGDSEYEPMTSKKLEEVFSALKKDGFRYTFDPRGFVVVTAPDAPDYEEVWGVNLITGEVDLGGSKMKPGDILMTLSGGENGGPVYFRHLRRVQ